ncbi:hypothetical protein ABFT23_01820 [Nocardioides sp. C4-1]|uniref:hypothetical protein n=1 Tax=Nocardioides sp. C4-1 TaxID=3151851 RepID=UPI003265B7E6
MLELHLTGCGSWVPGRLTHAGHELMFRPRRSLLEVRMSLDLRDVTLVETTRGRFTSTVSFRTPTHLLRLRARSSRVAALVEQLATPRLVHDGQPEVAPSETVTPWVARRAG